MKKILCSRIFLVIICGIIFTSLGVYAANNFLAEEIDYEPEDSAEVMNVKEALDDLYDRASESDKKYYKYDFDKVAAEVGGTHPIYTDGKWVNMTYHKTKNCKNGTCEYEGGYVSFEIDLGFTPSEVVGAYVYLQAGSASRTLTGEDPWRGFKYGNLYSRTLSATYPSNKIHIYDEVEQKCEHYICPMESGSDCKPVVCEVVSITPKYSWDDYGTVYSTGSDLTAPNSYDFTSIEISGSKLIFKVNVHRNLTTNGTTNSAFSVKTYVDPISGGSFYLTGSIIYKK